jgi:hypothetical protein
MTLNEEDRMSNKAKKARNFAALSGTALVAAPLMTSGVASADAYTVTNLAASGDGSLLKAIEDANSHPGADTITFQAGLSGTITLGGDALYITESVTITGPGSSLVTIDADGADNPVFYTRDQTGEGTIAISGLTLTGVDGDTYGSFNIWGDDVTLTDIVLTGNTAGYSGGIYFDGSYDGDAGTLTIRNSTISGNEGTDYTGGVYVTDGGSAADPVFIMTDSTVSGNIGADYGGGLYFDQSIDGDIVIANSTISGNTAGAGGGIYIEGSANSDVELLISSSTIVGNSVTGYGGGLYIGSTFLGDVTISNSVITGNTAASDGDDIYVTSDSTVTANYSLIGEVVGTTLAGANNIAGDPDPMLGALENNGGSTKTHLPQAGSPLIDAGDPLFGVEPSAAAYPTTDQRGYARVYNSVIDIGAVEVGPATLPPTGGSNGLMATIGAGLLALGGALHLTGRRKRTA